MPHRARTPDDQTQTPGRPATHTCGPYPGQVARENDTPRGVAQQHGRELEALLSLNRHALPDVQPAHRFKAGTLVLLPRALVEAAGGAAGAAEAAAAAKRKKKLKVLPQLGERIEVEVEVEEGDGATVWKPAEVRGLLPSGVGFSACVAEDEDFIEEYSLQACYLVITPSTPNTPSRPRA